MTVEPERAEGHIVAGLAARLLKGVPGHEVGRRGDAGHEGPAFPLAAFTTENGCLRPHRVGRQSEEVILHRTEPEELRDQTAVGVACGLHPGGDLESVDHLGEWCSVDAGDDHERAAVAKVLAVEPDVVAGHPVIVAAKSCPPSGG
ncbi:hypothetical protein [Streptomyces sp. NPDC094149]|uniref:hypothetical protein n=1 Tax=Streptomyces sp. NPDC094149 TaxID=3155079 RepID=UPI00332A6555